MSHRAHTLDDAFFQAFFEIESPLAYADALTALGYRVRGLALHWKRRGMVQLVEGEA